MKKIFLLVSLLCTLFVAGTAMAYDPYPAHLNGDSNYILIDGHMGTA